MVYWSLDLRILKGCTALLTLVPAMQWCVGTGCSLLPCLPSLSFSILLSLSLSFSIPSFPLYVHTCFANFLEKQHFFFSTTGRSSFSVFCSIRNLTGGDFSSGFELAVIFIQALCFSVFIVSFNTCSTYVMDNILSKFFYFRCAVYCLRFLSKFYVHVNQLQSSRLSSHVDSNLLSPKRLV